jgi:GxxExxY protein
MDTESTNKLIYFDLTREVIGALFEVHNNLGEGLLEKHYQKALAEEFKRRNINFIEQFPVPLDYKGVSIGRYYLDFLIEDKIVLEIKRDIHFSRVQIQQSLNYLKALNLQLGLLAHFGKDEVRFKRIVNIH